MKTSFKRFAALALAAIMVLGTMNLTTFGDEIGSSSGTNNLTKDAALVIGGLDEGDVVRFYQVLTEDEDAVVDGGWAYTSSFMGMSSSISVSNLIGNPAKSKDMGITAEIAGQIARYTVSATPAQTLTVADGADSVTWDSPAPASGMYVAIITPADPDVVYNPVFVSVDYKVNASASKSIALSAAEYYDKAAAKKSKLTIKKSADTTEDSWDDGANGADNSEYTTAIGDSVSFFVDTTIPGFGPSYEHPQFVMKDTLTALELLTDSLAVYKGNPKGDRIPESAYTTNPLTSSGYTITFAEWYLKSLKAPQDIRVEYTARVTTEALANVNIENNTVDIKYSTNPTDSSEFAVKKDETNHYTFTLDANSLFEGDQIQGSKGSELVKVGLDAAGNPIKTSRVTSEISKSEHVDGPLQGAKFKLYTDPSCTPDKEYKPKDPTTGIPKSQGLDLTSGPDGRFTIPGLDAGIYFLKEIQAPAGYVKYQDPVKIEITTEFQTVEVTQWFFNEQWKDTRAEAIALAVAAGYPDVSDSSAIPASSTKKKTASEMVKEYKYTTDVLKSYKIYVGGKTINDNGTLVASYTFNHPATSTEIKYSISDPVELPYSIPNTQGVELPSTGGIGTTIFYAGGAMLVLLAGILLVSKRRIA